MSLPTEVLLMYEDIYEECLKIATKNMRPFGYHPAEIKAAANDLYEERCNELECWPERGIPNVSGIEL